MQIHLHTNALLRKISCTVLQVEMEREWKREGVREREMKRGSEQGTNRDGGGRERMLTFALAFSTTAKVAQCSYNTSTKYQICQ